MMTPTERLRIADARALATQRALLLASPETPRATIERLRREATEARTEQEKAAKAAGRLK